MDRNAFEDFGEVWYSGSVLVALMLWGLAVFLFIIAILPYPFKVHYHWCDVLGAWALTFPNGEFGQTKLSSMNDTDSDHHEVGWINSLALFADIFGVRAFNVIHITMTSVICLVWVVLVVLTATAFWRGDILMSSAEDVVAERRGIKQMIENEKARKEKEKKEKGGGLLPVHR
jgi:tellurite resistance protein TehA-like permease